MLEFKAFQRAVMAVWLFSVASACYLSLGGNGPGRTMLG